MKVTALILTAAVVLTLACSTPPATIASSPAVTAATPTSPVASAPATASPTGRAGIATDENPILGYRISLPDAYRRLTSVVLTGGGEDLGYVPPREWETGTVDGREAVKLVWVIPANERMYVLMPALSSLP